MKVKHPLKIENVGSDVYMVMSKGHHDPHVFMKEVMRCGYDWPLGPPEHIWLKTVPCRCGEHYSHYTTRETYKKGWAPATYSVEAYGDDRYQLPTSVPSELCEVSDG